MTCAGCGCVCDDGRTCALGDAWFALGDRPPLARIDGREVELGEAVDAAAALLKAARAPLVYGLGGTSIEAQRRAVALAEASAIAPSWWWCGARTRWSRIRACSSACA
jgi:formylmethanofuran dehydrogenase subunit B